MGVCELHLQGVSQHVQVTAVAPLQLEGVVGRLDQLQGRRRWWQGPSGHLVDGAEASGANTVHCLDTQPAWRTKKVLCEIIGNIL